MKQRTAKYLATNVETISVSTNMPTNFEPKRLKPKLDIVEHPENRVHRLTDSNVFPSNYSTIEVCMPVWLTVMAN